ncbi:MAG: MerR family transcriptional regulator [Chloroflexi bacterium]|nr:MerR family transcriptional regulator [Chloroflexota bacterium]|tara:strand:+ start:37562 stop:37981 length:420 start_codon:yes stop_codon:yes gene_type:complete
MVKKTYFISHQSYLDTVNSDESYTYLRGVYVISVAAKMARMHPQTLRKYERVGVVIPNRTSGDQRLYSDMDVKRLQITKQLIDDYGLNLNGVSLILKILDVLNVWKDLLDKKRKNNNSTDLDEIYQNIKSLINNISPTK